MNSRFHYLCCSGLMLFGVALASPAEEPKPISLPPSRFQGEKTLWQSLWQRQTLREIKTNALPQQVLGNLLWAAFGINRPENGHRTAPSAMNSQEIDVYVALREGLYLYEPKPHQLSPVAGQDIRAKTSGQAFGSNAPVTLIFVADLSRLAKAKPETRLLYANFDAGCISQNVYLFCAAAGLATVVHDLDRAVLRPLMNLRPEQEIIMAQAVGYPQPTNSAATGPKAASGPGH